MSNLKDERKRGGRVQRSGKVVTSGEKSSEDGPHLVLAYAIRQTHLRLGRD